MQTIHVTLPVESQEFVEKQVATGAFATPEDYVKKLVEAERLRKAQDELEELILEGMRSPRVPLTPELWESMRRDAEALAKSRKAAREAS
jgi:antitoxin ParD1/3/4